MESLTSGFVWLWTAVLTAVYFLVVITMIATIHEYGHYIICKLLGVRVDEFSIGFGKLLFGRKWGETEYNLRAWPIAAYVRPAGMDPAEEEMEGYVDPGERSFNKKNSLVKYAILLGGSVFNLLSTILFLTLLFMYVGEGDTCVLVRDVAPNGPADVAGIKGSDLIVSMDGERIKDADQAIQRIKARPAQKISIAVKRGDQEIPLVISPESDDGTGRIGITYNAQVDETTFRRMAFWPALVKARAKTWEYVMLTYSAAIKMFTRSVAKKEIPKEMGGPVSILGAVWAKVKAGMNIQGFLEILAMLSLAIGVFNLLPIPALDGGRILVLFVRDAIDLAYTLVFWKHPDETIFSHRMEEMVHLLGIIVLLILLVLVTFKDIRELIFGREQPKLPTYSASPGASPSAAPIPSPFASPSPISNPSPSPAR